MCKLPAFRNGLNIQKLSMIKSMTGFGKAVEELNDKTITVEIRSLNSKQMDLNLRINGQPKDKELELRTEITRELERGKIDLSVYIEGKEENNTVSINKELAMVYHQQLKQLAQLLQENNADLMDQVLKMPDVIKNDRKELDEEEWGKVKAVIRKALEAIQQYRNDEGKSLETAFRNHIGVISAKLNQVEQLDKRRMENVRERIQKNLNEFIPSDKLDKNRFEQELIYYLERMDITEEKIRLKTHCDYFLSVMGEDAAGRKLNFISQEIGREINTIGSKANDAALQKIVVEMKDELEKIKEQTMNVL